MIQVIKFSMQTCRPCKMVQVSMDRLKARFHGEPVDFINVDIDEDINTAILNDVKSVPVVLIKKDGVEQQRYVGAKVRFEDFEAAILKHLPNPAH